MLASPYHRAAAPPTQATRTRLAPVLVIAAATHAHAQPAPLTDIPSLSAETAFPVAIGHDGAVVGTLRTGVNAAAFGWSTRAGTEALPRVEIGAPASAAAINAEGVIVGSAAPTASARTPSVAAWTESNVFSLLGKPPSLDGAIATGIDDDGVIVGVTVGPPGWRREQAFSLDATGFAPLAAAPSAANAVSPAGLIVGWITDPSGVPTAAVWFPDGEAVRLPPLAAGRAAEATAIADAGLVAGTASTGCGTRAVLWRLDRPDAPPVDLGLLPGTVRAAAGGVNNRGDVVGVCDGPDGPRAFVWNAITGQVELSEFVDAEDAGAVRTAAAINDRREVVGLRARTGDAVRPRLGGFVLDISAVFPAGGCLADLAGTHGALGTLDGNDIAAFVRGFVGGEPAADLAPTAGRFGTLDGNDIAAFVRAFLEGCDG